MRRAASIRSVAVIGGGPAGVAAARFLRAENYFSIITVFEQRATTGGIWNYSGHADIAPFPSPVYESLKCSIPSIIMQYSDFPFPKGTPLLPGHEAVLKYLQQYAKEVIDLIAFRKKVVDVRLTSSTPTEQWAVVAQDLVSGERKETLFDAVVIANGRYDKPFFPPIQGLRAWKDAYPDAVLHSKAYRAPKPFEDKKTVIVGYSASGADIGSQIQAVCLQPMLISRRSTDTSKPKGEVLASTRFRTEIVKFVVEDRAIHFADGAVEKGVDAVIFCTGYTYSYPFLSSLPLFPDDGLENQNTFQHIFYIPYPTLAFVLVPLKVVAFPFCESQAAVISRIWSNRLTLPSSWKMEQWKERRLRERGSGRAFHKFDRASEVDYINGMYKLCLRASKKEGLINNGLGMLPPRWDRRGQWIREKMHDIAEAARALENDNKSALSIEDVGYNFPPEDAGESLEMTLYDELATGKEGYNAKA